jgi:hypothetical protein
LLDLKNNYKWPVAKAGGQISWDSGFQFFKKKRNYYQYITNGQISVLSLPQKNMYRINFKVNLRMLALLAMLTFLGSLLMAFFFYVKQVESSI